MSVGDLDWALCRSFLAVLREGSLSAAARRLGLTQPTLRRHIEALEQTVGTSLFLRSSIGLSPTETALLLRETAERMEAAAASFVRVSSAEAATPSGTVRITASEIMGAEVLPQILSDLRRRHASLRFELVLTNSTQDILRHEADIAVRMHRPSQEGLVARRIVTLRLGLYAYRRWLDANGEPTSLAALAASGDLIGYDREPLLRHWLAAQGIEIPATAFSLRSDSDLAQLSALRSGFGVGVCQEVLAAREPALRRVLPDISSDLEVWLVTHPDLTKILRIRVTMEALIRGLCDWGQMAD